MPAVEAPEPLRPDDADRVRADPALAARAWPRPHRRAAAAAVRVEGAADADERRRLSCGKAEAIELCGSEARRSGQAGAAPASRPTRSVVCADEPPLDRARLARGDQLADDRPQERVRDRRGADRAQALEVADRAGEQLVVAETLEERACGRRPRRARSEAVSMPGFGLGAEDEPAVRKLACRGSLAAGQHTREDAVAEPPSSCQMRAERRARASTGRRPDRRLERHAATLRCATAGPASAAGARRALG